MLKGGETNKLIRERHKKRIIVDSELTLNMNAYIEGEYIILIDIFLNMHKFRESILDSFYMCFVIIKNWEIV